MATAKYLDNAGEEARKLYKSIASSGKSYNERRKEQTQTLRDTMHPVWQALGKGQAVNGCKDKLSWARWVNPTAKNPERYFYKLMYDPGLNSVQSEKTVTLKPGVHVVIDGIKYEVPRLNRKTIADHHRAKGNAGFNIILVGMQAVIRKVKKREACPECLKNADVKDGRFVKHDYLPGPKKGNCAMSGQLVVLNERGKVVNTAVKVKAVAA
jgi:hypothetical protein